MVRRNTEWFIFFVGILIVFPVGASAENPVRLFSETVQSKTEFVEQTPDWEDWIREMAASSDNETGPLNWQEALSELAENPVCLNTADKEELERIPFLRADQIESLSYYLYRYGPMKSLSELLLVEGIDEQMFSWMKPFVSLGIRTEKMQEPTHFKKAFKYGKQELSARWGRVVQERAGYFHENERLDSGKWYVGDPNEAAFRYGFNYKEKLQWGVVLEKDAGEKIWDKKGGVDYCSFHVVLKGCKRLRSLFLGDYHLQTGQGLICSNAFSLGKSLSGMSFGQTDARISRHFSMSETGFFRGVAATWILKKYDRQSVETPNAYGVDFTFFCSDREVDAKIMDGSFSTISSTEWHRTLNERSLKDQLDVRTVGGRLAFSAEKTRIGLTWIGCRFDACCNPVWKPYNTFVIRGKQNGDMAIDYRCLYKGMVFFGECAVDDRAKTATIAGFTVQPYSRMRLLLIGRYYSPEYRAFYGNAFSEGGSVGNEYGCCVHVESSVFKRWRLNAYCDRFVFPWLRYGVDAPSSGVDWVVQGVRNFSSQGRVCLRFRSETKEKNDVDASSVLRAVEKETKRQLRVQIVHAGKPWTYKAALDGNVFHVQSGGQTMAGFCASQELGFQDNRRPFHFSLEYVLFDCDQYANRVYAYEKSLPGMFSIVPYYGRGSRFCLWFKYKMCKKLDVQVKLGHTFYRDRQQVGSDTETISGNQRTKMNALLQWKF